MTDREMKLREQYFDGPASDSMSLMQFFLSKGFDPRKEAKKKSKSNKKKTIGLVHIHNILEANIQ